MADPFELPCRQLVELLTDYLEGNLDPADVDRVEAHLGVCPPCQHVLDQFRETIELTGQLREEHVDALDTDVRAELLHAFGSAFPPAATD